MMNNNKQSSISPLLELDIDPDVAARKKAIRARRVNVVQLPVLRVFGYSFVALFIYFHNRYILDVPFAGPLRLFIGVVVPYILLTWATLALFFDRCRRFDLGLLFLGTDLLIYALAVYCTGGEQSMLFFLFMVRTADQVHSSFKRVLIMGHVCSGTYLLLLLILSLNEPQTFSWASGGGKLALIYSTNLYLAFISRFGGKIRERVAASMQLARDLIRELDQKTRELALASARAEAANQAKSEFLANMSHELRTPLHHIMGFTELVADGRVGPLTPVQGEYLNDVLNSSRHLLDLINDILDLSKVEAGRLELELSDVSVEEVMESSLRMVVEKAAKHQIRLEQFTMDAPRTLRTDERKLKQVLYNLISNAVKFTPDGGSVTVNACSKTSASLLEETGISNSGPVVLFEVRDSGVGLHEADLDRIFERFEQADGSSRRRFGGTGLGLSLTRDLVELHGGRIWAESPGPGKGSTFRFFIPLA